MEYVKKNKIALQKNQNQSADKIDNQNRIVGVIIVILHLCFDSDTRLLQP
jgi:hypothetical protein